MESMKMNQLIAKELNVSPKQVQQVIALLQDGNTVPFIARYRKEMTGALDEVQIKDIQDRFDYIKQLEQRKEEVIRLIEEQGKLTEELQQAIQQATVLQRVEDLYRPYKQKRRTRATVAKEKGLEPLAEQLLEFPKEAPLQLAQAFVDEEKEVANAEDALAGARDIIAEQIADDPEIREAIRHLTRQDGKIISTAKSSELDEKQVYEMYYEYEEPVKKAAPHRVLAMNRGEKEDVLRISISAPTNRFTSLIENKTISSKVKHTEAANEIRLAIEDSYKRLISPSVEREIRNELTEKAEEQAIHIFAENVRSLLLQPPMKGKVVLGVDPAYRTGCKLAAVDDTGKVLEISAIYPHPPQNDKEKAKQTIFQFLKKYPIEIVAIGNGTASRETEQFIADCLREFNEDIAYVIVNEAGASVYSASEIARAEFPELQVEQRSAVSIARRLQDPLAELVKIDPKAIGVGQYQHDVSQKKLSESLSFVVETAVNQVGVNINTASTSLLQYVSGLSKTVAENMVKLRNDQGKFNSRTQLKKVPRLGAKTYEQAIGFLRIQDGKNPLDATSIHPESYEAAKQLVQLVGMDISSIGSPELADKLKDISIPEVAEQLQIGELTLKDIIDSLLKPGRDPRDQFPQPLLKKDVLKMEDLQPGIELQGTVRNVVDFGAFVDIGVKQDGLVHISKLKNGFVKHPLDVVSLGDIVTVWVDQVDVAKGRIALTMLPPAKQV